MHSRVVLWAVAASFVSVCCMRAQTQPIAGVLLRASFDHWPVADVAAAGLRPLRTVGTPRLTTGHSGQGLALDGRSYLEFPAGANVASSGGTVALWFRPDDWGAKTYDNVFGLSDGNSNALHFERAHPGGQFRLVVGGPDTTGGMTRSLYSEGPLHNGTWVHIAASWEADSGRLELFLDGQSIAVHDGPGPVPLDPPAVLVGCGFGRLARAVVGVIDDLIILDHAVTPEEVVTLMAGVSANETKVALGNDALTVLIDRDTGCFTLGESGPMGGRLIMGPAHAYVRLGDREIMWPRFEAEESAVPLAPRLGSGRHRVFGANDPESALRLRCHVQVQETAPLALFWLDLHNDGNQPVSISQLGLLRTGESRGVSLAPAAADLRVFVDTGGLTGSGTREFSQPAARHSARGALVLHDLKEPFAASFSFVTFRQAGVENALVMDEQGAVAAASAICDYPGGTMLEAGETLTSEIVSFAIHQDGHTALEQWADTVMAINELSPPRFRPNGYNSWYAYRLEISEELVLANARMMRERWGSLGLEYVQIDHGWQYRNVVGNWVANERFAHGLPWLSEKLTGLGYTLGLWLSVTNVSEFAPLFTEHPEALMHNADGTPIVSAREWFWEPHGQTFSLDPTHPIGAAFYEETGKALYDVGCRYAKNDFQTNIAVGKAVLHDPHMSLGVPVYRRGMDLLRRGMGPDVAYHACNGMLNVIAGACDVAWTHRDMGNPRGDWESMQAWVNEFCSRYHVSGKFYWSDPDYLQVGQGTADETRVRMVICALGGGPVTLGDRLPDLSEDKLTLIPKCLPGYGMPARPLDLFTHLGYPRIWDLPVRTDWGTWHVVGVFNLDSDTARPELNLKQLGLDAAKPHVVYDFFADKLLGEIALSDDLELALRVPMPPTSVRLLRIAPREERPFILSTDMHLTQGGVELPAVRWDEETSSLRGRATRSPGLAGNLYVYVPQGFRPARAEFPYAAPVLTVPLEFTQSDIEWAVSFDQQ